MVDDTVLLGDAFLPVVQAGCAESMNEKRQNQPCDGQDMEGPGDRDQVSVCR